MKFKILIILLLTFSIFFAISYEESSNGLVDAVVWESGKTKVRLGDINNDGNIDIVSVGDHGNPLIGGATESGILIWFGDGQGNWSSYMFGYFGYGGVALGDVNNDGYMDIGYGIHHPYASGDLGNSCLEVALGDGTGLNWIAYDDGLDIGYNWGMMGTDFADINNDGLLDIGSIEFSTFDGYHVFINNGNGTWTHTFGVTETENGGSYDFFFGDINRDGNMDFALTYEKNVIFIGDGTGNFSPMDTGLPPSAPWGYYGISLGDVDNDGWLELARVNDQGGVEIWKYRPDLGRWINASYNLPSSGTYSYTQLIDIDMDGFVDLAAISPYGISIFKNMANGTYWWNITNIQFPEQGSPYAFWGRDFDHNGFVDFVAVVKEGDIINKIRAYRETSVPESLYIRPLYPNGYERFYAGSLRFIEWGCAVPPGMDIGYVKLELSTSGPDGPWELIADSLPNNGRYQWIIPLETPASDNCYIRYTVYTSQDTAVCISRRPFETLGMKISENVKDYEYSTSEHIPTFYRKNQFYHKVFDFTGKKVIPSSSGIYFIKLKGRNLKKIIILK
jgi:hypothetical protein